MNSIKVYELDQTGVVVDSNAISAPPAAFTKAQNAIADPIGEKGSIHKRPGLKALNATPGGGSVLGGTGVPITLGSAGPNFVNPFTDSAITLIPLRTFSFPVRPGPTFDDDSWWFDFDWNFDFDEGVEEDPNDTIANPDTFDITDTTLPPADEATPRPSAPTIVPYNWQGTFGSMNYLTCDADGTQHVTFPTNIGFLGQAPTQAGLIAPSFGFRDYTTNSFAFSSIAGGVNITLHQRPAASLNGVIYYGTDYVSQPTLQAYGGGYDRLARQFRASDGTTGKLINCVLAANAKVYVAVWLSGVTTANTARGAVFEFDPAGNTHRQLGATFAADQTPFSLLWAYGRLWVGTASNAASARVYWMRPDQDSDFTLDNTFAAGESAVADLAIFQGKIYGAVLNRTLAGSGICYVRSTVGAWTTSDSGTIDANGTHGNTRGYYSLLVWPKEDSGLASPTSALYAVRYGMTEDNALGNAGIRKFNGSAWAATSIVSATAGSTLYGLFGVSSNTIKPVLVFGEGTAYRYTIDGTTWTDASSNLTITSRGLFPTFFASVPGINGIAL